MIKNKIGHYDQVEARNLGVIYFRSKDGVEFMTPDISLLRALSVRDPKLNEIMNIPLHEYDI